MTKQALDTFRQIPGFPNYEINTHGEIRRLYKTSTRYLKPYISRRQYYIRIIDTRGKRVAMPVRSLMRLAFFPNIKEGEILYNKNGDSLDIWINNLGVTCRKKFNQKISGRGRRKPVLKLDRKGNIVDVYPSAEEAGKRNGWSSQMVRDRCNGKRESILAPDGYRYVWDEDYEY